MTSQTRVQSTSKKVLIFITFLFFNLWGQNNLALILEDSLITTK